MKCALPITIKEQYLLDFLAESNRIDGIPEGDVTAHQYAVAEKFLALENITVGDVCGFVEVFQPGAKLRERFGMNVRIGNYSPPPGSPEIRDRLESLLTYVNDGEGFDGHTYRAHQNYESLHPFTDCNGRSGRIIWLWMMGGRAPLGFLHTWYYQSLAHSAR